MCNWISNMASILFESSCCLLQNDPTVPLGIYLFLESRRGHGDPLHHQVFDLVRWSESLPMASLKWEIYIKITWKGSLCFLRFYFWNYKLPVDLLLCPLKWQKELREWWHSLTSQVSTYSSIVHTFEFLGKLYIRQVRYGVSQEEGIPCPHISLFPTF